MTEGSATSPEGPAWTGPFAYSRQVEFSETDMAGVVHFTHYLRYMEMAEHAYWRSIGISGMGRFEGIHLGWPRVRAECHYKRPLRFEDMVEIRVYVARVGRTSVDFRHALYQGDPAAGKLAATGRLTLTCADLDRGDPFESIPVPGWLRERIAVAPPSALTFM